MGSEDRFKKRKAKTTHKLRRSSSKRDSYDRVLIVCEGSKTEPLYFKDLIDNLQLNTANIAVDGSCGSSPSSVLDHAQKLWKAEKLTENPYDRVYCVFDKDSHASYLATLSKMSSPRLKGVFFSAQSVPSFEYWLLLHFTKTTKPYSRSGKLSPGALVLKDLKTKYPEYAKCSKEVFTKLKPLLESAKANAQHSLENAERDGTDNPTTHVHKLVDYLQQLKNS